MTAPAIKVEGAGKWYDLGGTVRTGGLLADQLGQMLKSPARMLKRGAARADSGRAKDGIWALKDVSFELHKGEALGLVGRNGAGKSTLLKLLSRITLPTEGRLEIRRADRNAARGRDRVPSRAHRPREHLPQRRDPRHAAREIAREVRRDRRVLRRSSGSSTRRSSATRAACTCGSAFAVAAHLEPEILIVDEVLAVGDAEFQRKCLGKMRGGRRTRAARWSSSATTSRPCSSSAPAPF